LARKTILPILQIQYDGSTANSLWQLKRLPCCRRIIAPLGVVDRPVNHPGNQRATRIVKRFRTLLIRFQIVQNY
jgi:hypothetical protein